MKKKEHPYIRSAKVISKKGHKPKARIICVTDHGRRQRTQKLNSSTDLDWLAQAFLNSLTTP